MRRTMTAEEIQDRRSIPVFTEEHAAAGLEPWQLVRADALVAFLSGPVSRAGDSLLSAIEERCGHEIAASLTDAVSDVESEAESMAERAYFVGLRDAGIDRIQDVVPASVWPVTDQAD